MKKKFCSIYTKTVFPKNIQPSGFCYVNNKENDK